MKHAYKIAGLGLAAGAAVMIAVAAPAVARGPAGGFGGDGPFGAAPGADSRGLFTLQFADLDTDGDGLITEAELSARTATLAAERLAEVDADGDGTVTAEELKAQIVARIGARIGDRVGARAGVGRQAPDPAAMADTMVARLLAARDSNEDGVLSGDELSPAADIAALVDRFDTDDDNAWSAEEFAQVSGGRGGFDGPGHGAKGGPDGKRR